MIPEKYIMRRWTQQAIEPVPMPTKPVLDDVMPEQSKLGLQTYQHHFSKLLNLEARVNRQKQLLGDT
jgi:hypothetical protein